MQGRLDEHPEKMRQPRETVGRPAIAPAGMMNRSEPSERRYPSDFLTEC